MRIGIGYDVHQLVGGRELILGGVKIPYERGLLGHSDADVLVHAVCDAILGAAGLGDIGCHFPDNDPRFKNIDSLILLSETCKMISGKGYRISNIDATIFAEKPKLSPYRNDMEHRIAKYAFIESNRVNIKATTTEGLGPIGRGEGMAAMSVVLLETL